MARKGWDSLSDSYRDRLQRQGISRNRYESGAPLYKARGHTSKPREAFNKRTARFVHRFGEPGDSPDILIEEIRGLGQVRGQKYMDYRREMTNLYESGDYAKAQTMYKKRDQRISGLTWYQDRNGNLVDGTWWYHGMFGG